MTSSREELGNTGSVETGFRKTECCTQTGTTGTNHDGIVLVVLQEVRTQESLRNQSGILNALTMTGYFSEMYPLASLARSGWLGLANTRARERNQSLRFKGTTLRGSLGIPAGREEENRRV